MTEYVYVTKYALTKGVVRSSVVKLDDDGYVQVRWPNAHGGWKLLPPSGYRHTEMNALKAAEQMRLKNIRSLENQIRKLKNLEIKVVEA